MIKNENKKYAYLISKIYIDMSHYNIKESVSSWEQILSLIRLIKEMPPKCNWPWDGQHWSPQVCWRPCHSRPWRWLGSPDRGWGRRRGTSGWPPPALPAGGVWLARTPGPRTTGAARRLVPLCTPPPGILQSDSAGYNWPRCLADLSWGKGVVLGLGWRRVYEGNTLPISSSYIECWGKSGSYLMKDSWRGWCSNNRIWGERELGRDRIMLATLFRGRGSKC